MSLRSALMLKMALNQQQAGSLTVESSEFLNTIENVTNTGNGALFEESKPGPSKEHSPTFFDNIITPDLSSELNSDQEQALAEMLEFVEDSDCSLKDKDYVSESPAAEREPDTSSSDNENILAMTGDKIDLTLDDDMLNDILKTMDVLQPPAASTSSSSCFFFQLTRRTGPKKVQTFYNTLEKKYAVIYGQFQSFCLLRDKLNQFEKEHKEFSKSETAIESDIKNLTSDLSALMEKKKKVKL
ncbi:unnamed protein product [Diabrotica balteata]|uniref:Uncharacterized protein n=1 Tax=Diabrotica balteata TaxID=107213 RepID=A0A9P0DTS8_DIABA|nr:unnamed protein product [Diabrotica balteata]